MTDTRTKDPLAGLAERMEQRPFISEYRTMKRSPAQTKDFDTLVRLRSDHFDTDNAWIMVEAGDDGGCVHIHNQRNGEASTGNVTIDREEFLRLVRWYLRPQTLRPADHSSAVGESEGG